MMAEWGIPWDYIDGHWTDRQFALMSRMLVDRKKRESGSRPERSSGKTTKFKDWLKGIE